VVRTLGKAWISPISTQLRGPDGSRLILVLVVHPQSLQRSRSTYGWIAPLPTSIFAGNPSEARGGSPTGAASLRGRRGRNLDRLLRSPTPSRFAATSLMTIGLGLGVATSRNDHYGAPSALLRSSRAALLVSLRGDEAARGGSSCRPCTARFGVRYQLRSYTGASR